MRIFAVAFLAIALVPFILLSGCCSYLTDITESDQIIENRPPQIDLTLNFTSGPSPFASSYTYWCYDPDNNIISCELKIDGKTYAKGTNQSTLFPEDYTYPDFYWEARKVPGNHTLEIIAIDSNGLTASKIVNFTVLSGEWLSEPGWYNCNENLYNPPCDYMYEEYCDKIVPENLVVREAAAQAISKHPGEFSLNQLLDIYDWVHSNIFYQNVPIDMWPPYPPDETLHTKSGDCKNQAVLIASMVEAIGGSARILYIPECRHAFTEVYLGTDQDVNALSNAVWAHYKVTKGTYPTWHTHKNANNETENWFIFDTAGGWYPGNTISECMDASNVYYLLDCNRDPEQLKAPVTYGTEYGPIVRQNDTQIIQPGWSYNYWIPPWMSTVPEYKWCHYKLQIKSLSTKPLNWYLTNKQGYLDHNAYRGFNYYYGEEQVMGTNYEFDWNKSDTFYIIIENEDPKSSITVKTEVIETCYKS
ncbi:MAG: transglutaminase-like domain-containing protein [Candidatus Micrarchaeia archaeon]